MRSRQTGSSLDHNAQVSGPGSSYGLTVVRRLEAGGGVVGEGGWGGLNVDNTGARQRERERERLSAHIPAASRERGWVQQEETQKKKKMKTVIKF